MKRLLEHPEVPAGQRDLKTLAQSGDWADRAFALRCNLPR
jgi:hypothetical protein